MKKFYEMILAADMKSLKFWEELLEKALIKRIIRLNTIQVEIRRRQQFTRRMKTYRRRLSESI